MTRRWMSWTAWHGTTGSKRGGENDGWTNHGGCGICLVLVAVLLAVVGSVLLHKKKKMVLLEIEHEYR